MYVEGGLRHTYRNGRLEDSDIPLVVSNVCADGIDRVCAENKLELELRT